MFILMKLVKERLEEKRAQAQEKNSE
jgi:hypothetical protein